MYTDNFNYIIIWGHRNFTHTHSYIHYGFYKAFIYLGYKCLWIDNINDNNYSKEIFKNSLFITEGQVDSNIPINKNSFYVLHNCNGDKYNIIPKENKINLQVFTLDCIEKHNAKKLPYEYGYYLDDCIIITWATDLLPHEINENIYNLDNIQNKTDNFINFIGMPTPPWDKVKEYCKINNIKYTNFGGFNMKTKVTAEENMKLVQKSIIAPSIQEEWQVKNSYIPCRIFKNISYGKMGLTNNPYVYELFNKKIIFDYEVVNLCDKGINFFFNHRSDIIIELMNIVKNKHTYINRINAIFWLINKIKN